ncbi:MAG: gliding motility-associated ABC transporter permease subunit GldF [Lentimicrobiaceae bacterium]|nr:gliding motility-associated ABC transporter permease subunit GldF [Lentimicrobiaceae bacterium]
MYTLFLKELNSFLHSLIGYVVIVVFLALTGLFLWVFPGDLNILDYGYANINGLFILAPWIFLFLIPAITMRSFAEEKRAGTIEMLLTKPLTDVQIIMAKYAASLALLLFSLLPTLVFYFSAHQLGLPKGNIDTGGMWGSYIGLLFLGGAFLSIGIFASSITDNQIISFILAAVLSVFFYTGFELLSSFEWLGQADLFVKSLGIRHHYVSMSRGVIDSRDVIYYISLILVFLALTRLSLESRKW